MEIVLIISTILGGIAAIWYFWDKWYAHSSSLTPPSTAFVPSAMPDPSPAQKWVDYDYPRDSGLQARLEQSGFKVAWCLDTNLARRLDLEGWEIVVEPDAQGVLSKFKLKDRPADQTLVKKRVS